MKLPSARALPQLLLIEDSVDSRHGSGGKYARHKYLYELSRLPLDAVSFDIRGTENSGAECLGFLGVSPDRSKRGSQSLSTEIHAPRLTVQRHIPTLETICLAAGL